MNEWTPKEGEWPTDYSRGPEPILDVMHGLYTSAVGLQYQLRGMPGFHHTVRATHIYTCVCMHTQRHAYPVYWDIYTLLWCYKLMQANPPGAGLVYNPQQAVPCPTGEDVDPEVPSPVV